jgi:hypothetical protein
MDLYGSKQGQMISPGDKSEHSGRIAGGQLPGCWFLEGTRHSAGNSH